MGLFSTLIVQSSCANCGNDMVLRIQFKYGELWNYSYSLNDEIRWGEVNAIDKTRNLVVLDGQAEKCAYCNKSNPYLIFVENGIIKSFKKNEGEYDFSSSDGEFLVLEN